MRILSMLTLTTAALALMACSPAAEEPAAATEPGQAEINSTTAPAVGGPAELPTDGGVTPAPEAMEDATAEEVAAPASPAEAAVLSGGAQNPRNQ